MSVNSQAVFAVHLLRISTPIPFPVLPSGLTPSESALVWGEACWFFSRGSWLMLLVCSLLTGAPTLQAQPAEGGWALVPGILERIVAPTFPDRDFPVTDYGAKGDGRTDSSTAFRRAIEACHASGGGRVVVPEGIFLTGPIHLKSRVNLHVSAGATIRFSTDPADYLPQVFTRWEGMECYNYSPLIYAFEQEDIAITGAGTLDGQATEGKWWDWKGPWGGDTTTGWREGLPDQRPARARLMQLVEAGTPVSERVFGEGDRLRPNFIQPYRCRNILIEGVKIINAPMWIIHPVLSRNVTIRGVTVVSHGPNNDGCNPESSVDVLIENCFFDTGDDCIAIKSGRDADGRRVATPSENIVIRGCTMRDGHGGVVIGSEISGDVRNVFAEDCRMDSPNLDRALRIKSNSRRGGTIEGIYMRNVVIGQVAQAVLGIDLLYERQTGPRPPVVRDIELSNVHCEQSQRALWIEGLPDLPIGRILIEDCEFERVDQPNIINHVSQLELVRTVFPKPTAP